MRFRDEQLVVKAPLNIPLKLLDDWIESKKEWILRQYRVQQTLNLNEDELYPLGYFFTAASVDNGVNFRIFRVTSHGGSHPQDDTDLEPMAKAFIKMKV